MIENMFAIYQRNHISIYLKYDVRGNVMLIEPKRDVITSKAVTVPMNLSLKSSSLINSVE